MPTQLAALEQVKSTLIDLAFRFGPKVLVAILILVAGGYCARWTGVAFDRWLGKLHLEPPVRQLLVRVSRLLVMGLFLVMALQNLGVDLLPMIAGLGVAGAGIALAMQGVLGNLAAGLTIIFTKPFRVGEILHNYGAIRQLDLSVAIVRTADLERALAAIEGVVKGNSRVLQEPAAAIGVRSLGEYSIGIAVKPWVKVPDVADAGAEINKGIVDAFRAAVIEYPAPIPARFPWKA